MAIKKVVVKGGGSNLYYVAESSDRIYIYKASGGLFGGKTQIATAKRLEDALAIIKAHSGRAIDYIG